MFNNKLHGTDVLNIIEGIIFQHDEVCSVSSFELAQGILLSDGPRSDNGCGLQSIHRREACTVDETNNLTDKALSRIAPVRIVVCSRRYHHPMVMGGSSHRAGD